MIHMTWDFAKHTCQQFAPCWVAFFVTAQMHHLVVYLVFHKKGEQLLWPREYYMVSRVSYPCQVCRNPLWREDDNTNTCRSIVFVSSSCKSNECIGETLFVFCVYFVGNLYIFYVHSLFMNQAKEHISHELVI